MSGSSAGLQVGEDPEFKRRSWRVQQVGWTVMFLILIAAGLGLLGGAGPFVHTATSSTVDASAVEYPRFVRVGSPIDVHIEVDADSVSSDQIRILLDRAYLQQYEVQQISPQPIMETVEDSSIAYTFQVGPSSGELVITFTMQAQYAGVSRGSIAIEDLPALEFWQMVYP